METYDARGKNVVKLMSLTLQISRNPYIKMLFMGHRGSGKSTELSLLKKQMEGQFDIISFYIYNEVDPVNMTYIDFIFAIMAQIIKYVEKKPEIGLDESDIDELYQYWYGEKIIEKSEMDYGEASASFDAKLSFLKKIAVKGSGILKTGKESKVSIRRKIEPKAGQLILMMNQLIQKINSKLTNKGLLLIIEDLDKISLDTAESLFITYRKIWLGLQVRIILTFPIFMAYNSKYNMINEDIDKAVILSMIKVKKADKTDYEQGIATLSKIVEKRAELSLIDDDALRFMIKKSGGAIRDLFEMIQDASFESMLIEKDKIEMSEAKSAYYQLKSRNERLIRNDSEVEKLVQVYQDPQLLTTDDTMMELLVKGLILEYNGERWCGIHPAVKDFLKEKGKI
ncbi:MAG: AAA family ATPase [Blautia sp.]|nr:AAA family ATPase [Blautia sp.]